METTIQLKPVSEQEVIEKNIALEQLWLIEHENNILGPYEEDELANYSQENSKEFTYSRACKVSDGVWHNFFDIKHFQRRQPKIVSAEHFDTTQSIYYIKNGEKFGPINFDIFSTLIEKGEIRARDNMSVNNKNWIKVAQHPLFDRRYGQSPIPFGKPADDSFMASNLELMTPSPSHNSKAEVDAIAGLSYLGSNKVKKFNSAELEKHYVFNLEKKEINLDKYFSNKKVNYAVSAAIVFFGIFIFSSPNKNDDDILAKKETNKQATTRAIASDENKSENSQEQRAKKVYTKPVTRRNPISNPVKANSFQYKPSPVKRTITHRPQPVKNNAPSRDVSHQPDNYENEAQNTDMPDERMPDEVVNEIQNEIEQQDPYPRD